METIYLAGGCLWGVQAYIKTLPGVIATEAGRANGSTPDLDSPYDGYAECVKTTFDSQQLPLQQLLNYFFEIIDPYSLNKQGPDQGPKYRTGVYSQNPKHLEEAQNYLRCQPHSNKIMVEVRPLTNYLKSAEEHQDRLEKHPDDYCHIPKELLEKYKR